jgi:2-keto-4-pentenoate hydratase/2-oxohepta-3-ene-1,7-dioic acid hydratase in catechol pathway
MRLCRYHYEDRVQVGLYDEKCVVSLTALAGAYFLNTTRAAELPRSEEIVDFLPPSPAYAKVQKLKACMDDNPPKLPNFLETPVDKVQLLMPVARPNKLLLLAGNFAEHIREQKGTATERSETFPYVFMKPPSTTLTNPGASVSIPSISPGAIDWELELAIVIGKRARRVREAEALDYVAGYTIINDISDRKFRPNPGRTKREKDSFFDWQHGKWHDGFCPCGPCIATPDEVGDPQKLGMKLSVNGQVKQDGSSAQQIFPVAAVIEFISNITTLEPGDIISTGTPSGVGNATGTYLKPGDMMEGSIERIGTLRTTMVAEEVGE